MKTEAPEKKSAKTLKGQLFGAVSMMLVAAIALGTSTYAWFISNQAVKVDTMELTVSTATSLLAAVGKTGSVANYNTAFNSAIYTNFKSVIITDDIIGTSDLSTQAGWKNFMRTSLAPASVTSASLALKNNSTAFPSFYKSLDKLTQNQVSNFAVLTHDSDADVATGLGQGPVKHLRLAMLGSSSDLNVYLGEAGSTDGTNTLDLSSLVTTSKSDSAKPVNNVSLENQAAAVRAALRVAIVPVATVNDTAATPVVLQFDDGNPVFSTHSINNTYYGNSTDASSPTTLNELLGKYKAVASVDNDGLITTYGQLSAERPSEKTGDTPYINPYIAPVTTTDGNSTVDGTGKTPLFTLTANKEQIVDIYIWLEGTDRDCVNDLSSYYFGLRLPFVAAVKTPTT